MVQYSKAVLASWTPLPELCVKSNVKIHRWHFAVFLCVYVASFDFVTMPAFHDGA